MRNPAYSSAGVFKDRYESGGAAAIIDLMGKTRSALNGLSGVNCGSEAGVVEVDPGAGFSLAVSVVEDCSRVTAASWAADDTFSFFGVKLSLDGVRECALVSIAEGSTSPISCAKRIALLTGAIAVDDDGGR